MTTRARAVQEWAKDRLCAECGTRLVAGPSGAFCPLTPGHVGSLAAPSGILARVMVEWGRGLEADAKVVAAYRGPLAYWLMRLHMWGNHRLCPFLNPLLGENLDCCIGEALKHPPPYPGLAVISPSECAAECTECPAPSGTDRATVEAALGGCQ